MYLDSYILMLVYFISIFVFFNFSSCFIFWFWLEFNMIIFLGLMISDKNNLNELNIFSQSLYYFIIQSFSSLFFLFFVSYDYFIYKDFFLFLVLLMKLGIFPFYFWIFKICEYLNMKSLFLILNFQKIPLLIFLSSYNYKIIYFVMLMNMILGCLFLLKSNSFLDLIVSSSICFFNWIFFMLIWNIFGFFIFCAKYFSLNFILMKMKKFFLVYERSFFFFPKLFLMLIFLMGLPPLMFFYFKFYVLNSIFIFSNFMVISIFFLFSFVCLISYFNFFFFNFFKFKNLYESFMLMSKHDFFLLFCLSLSMILFL